MSADQRIDVRRLHQPLMDAGLIPKGCRLVSMSIGTSGALAIVYEVLITAEQLGTLGRVFATVSDAITHGHAMHLTPGCDCDQHGQPDPAVHADDCVWRVRLHDQPGPT